MGLLPHAEGMQWQPGWDALWALCTAACQLQYCYRRYTGADPFSVCKQNPCHLIGSQLQHCAALNPLCLCMPPTPPYPPPLLPPAVHPGIADTTWYLKSDDKYAFSWVISRVRSVAPFLGCGQPASCGAISSIYVSGAAQPAVAFGRGLEGWLHAGVVIA
jgi:hypothetical protein